MHTSQIDLLLEYEVFHPAHFRFNIESAFHEGQRVVEERRQSNIGILGKKR